jgi:transposase-like protein
MSEIQVPRDRDSSFAPALVPKRKNMAQGVEHIIISLYARGMSVSDIEEQIRELYNFELSTSAISRITEHVSQDIALWQNRTLEQVHYIVWMDSISFEIRDNSRVINKTVYAALAFAPTVKWKF